MPLINSSLVAARHIGFFVIMEEAAYRCAGSNVSHVATLFLSCEKSANSRSLSVLSVELRINFKFNPAFSTSEGKRDLYYGNPSGKQRYFAKNTVYF